MALRSGALKNGDRDRRLLNAAQAAAVLGQRDFGVGNLARAGLTAAEGQPPTAPEPPKAEAAAVKFSTKTPLTVLMANPQAKDVLRKYLPQVVELLDSGGAAQAPADFNVESLSAIPRANLTPEILKSINEDLAKL